VGTKHSAPHAKLAYYLLKGLNKAINEYGMIANRDRIAVAVSGGKDSLTLLDLLRIRQTSAREKYSLVAIHVSMHRADEPACTVKDAEQKLSDYLDAEGYEHALQPVDAEDAHGCFRCSYLRRRAIFTAAKRLGCHKVALGHHADDAAQTTLLNLMYHGRVETLHPTRTFFGGEMVLIRPMLYVPEKDIARYAWLRGFPTEEHCCPQSLTSRRALARNIIRLIEHDYPKVKINLLRAGLQVVGQR
jgi:tRNA 2-thiocytidine biosynthesis protein TtcA